MFYKIDASIDASTDALIYIININIMTKIVRKLRKGSEYSYSINIPKDIVDKYGWRSKQKLTIEDKGRGILEIKDWRKQ